MLDEQRYAEGSGAQWGPGAKYGHYGLNFPENLDNATFLGLDVPHLETLAFLDPGILLDNCISATIPLRYF